LCNVLKSLKINIWRRKGYLRVFTLKIINLLEKETRKMEKFKAFVMSNEFITGLVLGFALGALHHYFGL